MLELKPNWIDSLINFIDPVAANKRISARIANDLITRRYEGAGRGRRWAGNKDSSASAEAEVGGAGNLLRFRARDLVRNNSEAANAVETLVANIVGSGIIPKIEDSLLSRTFNEWAIDSGEIDFHKEMNLYEIQELVCRTVVESGSAFILRVRDARASVPFRIQVLEPDYLDKSQDLLLGNGGNEVRYGIEYDRSGRRVAYYLFEEHPGDTRNMRSFIRRTRRVPASEVIHVFHKKRPGQHDGVPWLTPILLRLRDYEDYEDAQLVRQKIAACFVGFITDMDGPVNSSTSDEDKKPMSDKFEPGAWEVLPSGKDIKFSQPPDVGSDYKSFTTRQLQRIAAGIGMTYEQLTSDYSNTNFTSGRMGKIEFTQKLAIWQYNLMCRRFCEPLWRWFVEGASLTPAVNGATRFDHRWTAPVPQLIDPAREVKAYGEMARHGFRSISEIIREMGYDPDQIMNELAQDTELADSLNLKLDSIPRHTTTAGIKQLDETEGTEN